MTLTPEQRQRVASAVIRIVKEEAFADPIVASIYIAGIQTGIVFSNLFPDQAQAMMETWDNLNEVIDAEARQGLREGVSLLAQVVREAL